MDYKLIDEHSRLNRFVLCSFRSGSFYTKDNIKSLSNIIRFAQEWKRPLLLSIDVEKAFDRVEWPFLKLPFSLNPRPAKNQKPVQLFFLVFFDTIG